MKESLFECFDIDIWYDIAASLKSVSFFAEEHIMRLFAFWAYACPQFTYSY